MFKIKNEVKKSVIGLAAHEVARIGSHGAILSFSKDGLDVKVGGVEMTATVEDIVRMALASKKAAPVAHDPSKVMYAEGGSKRTAANNGMVYAKGLGLAMEAEIGKPLGKGAIQVYIREHNKECVVDGRPLSVIAFKETKKGRQYLLADTLPKLAAYYTRCKHKADAIHRHTITKVRSLKQPKGAQEGTLETGLGAGASQS